MKNWLIVALEHVKWYACNCFIIKYTISNDGLRKVWSNLQSIILQWNIKVIEFASINNQMKWIYNQQRSITNDVIKHAVTYNSILIAVTNPAIKYAITNELKNMQSQTIW